MTARWLWEKLGFVPTQEWKAIAELERQDAAWVKATMARAVEVKVDKATLAHMGWNLPGWAPHFREVSARLDALRGKERMACKLWLAHQREKEGT